MRRKLAKRILVTILTAGMVIGLVACSESKKANENILNEDVTSNLQSEDDYIDKIDRTDEGLKLVWNDEFDGDALDTTKWSYQYGTGADEGLDGWGNSELQYYTDREENVRVEDGKLIITAIKEEYEGMGYTSGRIRTFTNEDETLFSTKYGRVEARMKLPAGEGVWPAFWMLPVDPDIYGGWAASGEIDIMEARGRLPEQIGGTVHYGKNWPDNTYKSMDYVFEEGTDITDYHLYSLEWEPGVLRWFVDDECYFTMDNWYSKGKANGTDYAWPAPFDVPFYILFNVAVGGTFDPDANVKKTEFPVQMEVDYVRVYQKEDGYDTASANTETVVDKRDTAGFEEYAAIYEDGEFIVDKEFATMNTEAIRDTTNGVVADNKDWQFAVGAFGGAATAAVEDLEEGKFARIDITQGGNQNYAVQLIQHMPLIEGYTYQVTFDAKAVVDRSFVVAPSGDADNSWQKYGTQDIAVGKEVDTYSYVFKMNSTTDPTARMEFNLGQATGSVWIGNVSVKVVETEGGVDDDMDKTPLYDGNVVYNGTFDQGNGRLAFWHVENMEINIPDYIITEDGAEDYSRMAQLIATGADAKLYQNSLQLKSGTKYSLTFDLAGVNPAELNVMIVGSDGTTYVEEICNVAGDDKTENFKISFTIPEIGDDTSAALIFSLPEGTSINIDNIKVIKE